VCSRLFPETCVLVIENSEYEVFFSRIYTGELRVLNSGRAHVHKIDIEGEGEWVGEGVREKK
jgi:hypothetical protein